MNTHGKRMTGWLRHATDSKRRAIRALVALLGASTVPATAAPLDTVLAAVAAEEAAPVERIRMFIEKAGSADVFYVDRVRPGRVRVLKNPRQGGPEMIIIDNSLWVRTDTGWQKSPAPANTGPVPSIAAMFKDGLSAAVEAAGPDGSRIVEGEMAWTNAATCKGQLRLRIERTGLPSLLRFTGTCGGMPTRFRQAFSYVGPVTIEPPQ
jgi:hypothetical protein